MGNAGERCLLRCAWGGEEGGGEAAGGQVGGIHVPFLPYCWLVAGIDFTFLPNLH